MSEDTPSFEVHGGHLWFGDKDVHDIVVAEKDVKQIGSAGAHFSNVVFQKLNARLSLGAGRVLTTLTDCIFDRCVFKGGGMGWLHFERCEFRRCTLRNMIMLGSSFVGCKFSGKIINSVFCASLLPHNLRDGVKTRNEIVDNDFSECVFDAVGFRGGVDLERQRLPKAPPGLLCVDGRAAIKALYERFARGKSNADHPASCVRVLKEELAGGQQHLYISPGSPFRHTTDVEPILELLRANAMGRDVP